MFITAQQSRNNTNDIGIIHPVLIKSCMDPDTNWYILSILFADITNNQNISINVWHFDKKALIPISRILLEVIRNARSWHLTCRKHVVIGTWIILLNNNHKRICSQMLNKHVGYQEMLSLSVFQKFIKTWLFMSR